jgi:hypothetical protein
MNVAHQLSARVREVFLNGTWIANTNFKHQISQINYSQATCVVQDYNTIALLTFHLQYYLSGVNQVFEGGTLDIKDKYSYDMPEIACEQDWLDLVAKFLQSAETFANHVERMSDYDLNQPFVDEKYGSYQRNVEGMIEHGYYHLGQISLIAKSVKQM